MVDYSSLHIFNRVVCENLSAYSPQELENAAATWNQNKYFDCLNKIRKHVPLLNVKY